MELLEDGLIAFFSAVGLTACVWMVAGAFLSGERCRNPEILLVLPLRGSAPAMESDVRELLRVRRNLPEAKIILADCGLEPESRDLAEYFCQKHRNVELRSAAEFKLE
jgi:hypothetical protein